MAYAKKKTKDAKEPVDIGFEQLIDWVNEADDGTVDSRERSEKCRDYYDSKQLTDAEVRQLKKRKQAPVVVNRVKPKIDGLMGMERTNKTTAKCFGRTPKEEKAAQAATEAIRYVLQSEFYEMARSAAWENLLIEGTGGIEVIAEDKGDKVKITLNHLMWDRLIYDAHSRRKDFGDARYLGQVIWLDYDIALARFPGGKDMLEAMFESRSGTYDDKPRWLDTKRRRVKVVELYYLKGGDWWYACFTRGGYLNQPKKSPYVTETGETEHPYEFASLFVDREGCRYGAMLQLLDVQDEINKRRSKALHLMSVRQVRWERGAVEDINKARDELAKPDGVLETTPGMEFEVLKTNDMAQAQFKLLEDAKLEIDAVSYNAAASGKDERLQSGVALRNREAAAQTELAPMFGQLKHLDVRVYRKIWNRIKQYWKDEMWIRVTDNQENLRWVGLNRPMTKADALMQEAQQRNAKPEELAALQQQLAADPAMQEKIIHNDVAEMDIDIIVDDAPDAVTMQEEEFRALSEMVKSGIPIPATAIVASSNLKDKDKIIEEMKNAPQIPPQVQKQMEEMQAQVQQLGQENMQLKNDHSTEFAKLNMQHDHKMKEMAMGQESGAMQMQNERAKLEADFALKAEMQQKEIQLAREKAEAEAAIKLMTAQNDAKIAEMQMQTKAQQDEKSMLHEQKHTEMKFAAEQKQREFDNEHKIKEQQKKDESTAAPAFSSALKEITKGFQQALEQNAKLLEAALKQLADSNNSAKSITLGGIKRDSEGNLTSATAKVH